MKSKSRVKTFVARSVLSVASLFISVCACAQPVAGFTGDAVSGCAPMLVHFTDQSTGNPDYRKWDLGDGTVSYVQNPSVTYFIPGSYSIKLVVKNAAGTDSAVKTHYVQVYAPPSINFTASVTATCSDSLPVHFTNQSNEGASWQWDLGDGLFSAESNPAHVYTRPGSYNVSLKVTNGEGCTATLLKQAYINVNTLQANFSNNVVYTCSPTRISFYNGAGSYGNVSSKWFFGNGDSSAQPNPAYIYPAGGNYAVTLKVKNAFGCESSITKNITVAEPVSANFTADIEQACKTPATIHFTGPVAGGNTYYWSFGDKGYSAISNPAHVFTDTGSYTVKLVVKNNGCADSVIKTGYIQVHRPSVSFDNLPDSGCVPFTKKLAAIPDSTDNITAYRWDFGDGQYSNSSSPAHVYSLQGAYTVSLISTHASGCKDTTVFRNAINTGNKPAAAFTADSLTACAQPGIQFRNLSTGATDWLWDFGDNVLSTEQNPRHGFVDTGFLPIRLIAFNHGCADTVRKDHYVSIKPAVAKFKLDFDCAHPLTFSFLNFSMGAESWRWDFGDGTTSAQFNPVHTYTDTGSYFVSLSVVNTATGCNYWLGKSIQVAKLSPDFSAADSSVCRGEEAVFTSAVATGNANRFLWDFGDGSTASTLGNSVSHIYDEAGVYTVRLIVINLVNCRDTVIKTNYITVNGLKANFNRSALNACAGATVAFSDSSFTEGDNRIQNWHWNFGDGQAVDYPAPPFTHTYNAQGSFLVRLKITDNNGCSDSTISDLPLTITKVNPLLLVYDTVKCTSSGVRFVASYTAQNASYYWDFGDGNTASVQRPVHNYTAEGRYTIKLRVSYGGCSDSSMRTNAVKIENPTAKFVMSDSFRNCPPLIIQFTNQSANAAEELWDFGDGSTTTVHNPSHFYSYPGRYTVSLTVKGAGGCSSSMQKQVVVNGPKGTFSYTPLTFCGVGTATFRAHTVDAVSCVWDFNDGNILVNTDSIVTHRYDNAGSYFPKLMLADENGCRVPINGRDSIHIVNVSAQFDIPNTTLCAGGHIVFNNTGNTSESITSAYWDFGDGFYATSITAPGHDYETPGTYYPSLVVTTVHGCTDSFTVAEPVKVAAAPDVSIRSTGNGCVPLQQVFTGINNGAVPVAQWQWDFGNGNTGASQNPPAQTYNTGGNYNVVLKVTTNEGCERTFSGTIEAYSLPLVNAGDDKSIRAGSVVELIPVVSPDVAAVRWSPTGDIFRNEGNGITVKPATTTEYTVEVENTNGCAATDRITVTVSNTNTAGDLFIPNTFSPNGDGVNEVFYPRSSGSIQINRLKILNRAGLVVFEKMNFYTNDAANGWDGTLRGTRLPADVYVYILEMPGSNGKPVMLSGNIALVR